MILICLPSEIYLDRSYRGSYLWIRPLWIVLEINELDCSMKYGVFILFLHHHDLSSS